VYGRDLRFPEQTLDDRLQIGFVGHDGVVFVVHRLVGPIGAQDARLGVPTATTERLALAGGGERAPAARSARLASVLTGRR
jgi:hypothetical protein